MDKRILTAVVCLVVGAFIKFTAAVLLNRTKKERTEPKEKQTNEKQIKEPVRLLMVNNTVLWKPTKWTIKRFSVGSNGQTYAELECFDSGNYYRRLAYAPVEELEAVEE